MGETHLMVTSALRKVFRAVLIGFASLFSFGEPERHFAEPPAIVQPTIAETSDRENDEPDEATE